MYILGFLSLLNVGWLLEFYEEISNCSFRILVVLEWSKLCLLVWECMCYGVKVRSSYN